MSGIKDLFHEYNGKTIALYGLGTETEKALPSLEGRFRIAGLLDSFREGGEVYGKRILSLAEAVEKGVALIIVVARPGSCKAISRKIGNVCREHGIDLIDIRGKDLLKKSKVTYHFSDAAGGTREELYRKIGRADAVSFDLFDTLVMREVLSPADMICLTDASLKARGICISNFTSLRQEAEKRLSQDGAPALETIYDDIIKQINDTGGFVPASASELARLEWETDYRTIIPRKAVCDVYEYCIRSGKRVYIVTDTYYRQERIVEILGKCRLTGYTGLLVSCEYNTGKCQKLFDRLKELEENRRLLHIGDDLTADVEMASREGMDTFHIFSSEELLETAGNLGMEKYMERPAERLKAGMFAARLFNSPFWFEEGERLIGLGDAYDIGYLICAPIITDFVFWFREQVRHHGLRNIWFCSRDGYLIRKLYQMLDRRTESVYFQTSRMAAVRAGMEDEEDIAYVDSMKFSGTLEESLSVRFGLNAGAVEPDAGATADKGKGLLRYRESILESAARERKNYRKYIEGLEIKKGPVAFFDFVAKGTTQMYVQRLVDHHLKGLYFLQLEPDFMSDRGLDIEPYYRTDETDLSTIYDNYYVLETILTAPHPGVYGFDGSGKALYGEETRTDRDIRCFGRVQEGIQDYFRRYLELMPEGVSSQSRELDEVLLGLIQNLKIKDEDFLALVVEDPFFNRMTDIAELV